MRRTSTDADYLRDGTVRVDADGVPLDLSLPLRLDTSVGARIMAGDTMIYGDTGVRNITPLVPDLSGGAVLVRRVGLATYMHLDYVAANSGTTPTFTIPAGWFPPATMSYPLTDANGVVAGQLYHRNRSVELRLTGTVAGVITMPWVVSVSPWPASQLGNPY